MTIYNELLDKVNKGLLNTKFKPFQPYAFSSDQVDEYKNYVGKTSGMAVVYWHPGMFQFAYNNDGNKILHYSSEPVLPTFYGKLVRKGYLYLKEITNL